MPAADATLDYKSLSLPDWRTALKKRIKKPKKPTFWQIYWLILSVQNGISAIVDISAGKYRDAAAELITCAIEYKLSQYARNIASKEYLVNLAVLVAFAFSTIFWV